MEPVKKRVRSQVWEHFDLISPNKIQCLLCPRQLAYKDNTSSMLRHLRAKHANSQPSCNQARDSQVTRKQELDDALVDMIVKDAQPYTIVEDVGFKELVHKLDPTYVLPTSQAVKAMIQEKYEESKEKAKSDVQKAAADMWTSIHMDAYLAVTCHYVGENELHGMSISSFSVS
ncbi:hypothetical protein LDENG_00280640 [Lucifuga dentata]|nr:hypothetical protein LDENG_00280640 [Lucifuga dentata]